jgi:hypothetical protein
MGTTTRFIAPRVPFVDQNGMITREWFLFLQSLFPAQLGGIADDFALGGDAVVSPIRDELAELRKRVDDMGKGLVVL